ncbi:MAG TPA: serine--tRNA ligase [Nitrospiria bacterium]|jgi:seryl-tRNA synthetase
MLDIKKIRENPEKITSVLRKRGLIPDMTSLLNLDQDWKETLNQVNALKHKKNVVSDEIGKKSRNKEPVSQDLREEMRKVGEEIKRLDEKVRDYEKQLDVLLLNLPNIPHESVPVAENEQGNQDIRKWGKHPEFSFRPKAHWDIGEDLGILDFEAGGKITGARFTLYRGLGARLERALINFMLDIHTKEHGYLEVIPPFIVNRESTMGTGQLPKFEDDLFYLSKEDYFLIPTAEVPVTNIHRGEILEAERLPICYVAYTPCFRREAGSYGKDTRGLIRQHQFNKVEMVRFVKPEDSYSELEILLSHAEEVLKRLEIPYRVVVLCTGDLGFASAKTYDIEVWLPGQGSYKEISSCSNFEDFQARRMSIRYRAQKKQTQLVHTLNGSGLAVGRTLVAILENFQREDGSVSIPLALRPYMGDEELITKNN